MWTISQIMFTGVTFGSITAAIRGCIDKEEEEGTDENFTPSLTPFQTDATVLPASKPLFLHPNSSETFQFQGNNITISYLSTSSHQVEVTIGGDTEAIEINRSIKYSGNHCGYYATKDDIDYSIKPVVWRYDEAGERIWSFETWNSS
ncbi:MAG: hypothetical protein C5S40_05480 [ANME-2 cluster archaeon]|nr:hypothetical protein [ANME-2 cluster archaeon]